MAKPIENGKMLLRKAFVMSAERSPLARLHPASSCDDKGDALAAKGTILGRVAFDEDVVTGEKRHAEVDAPTGAVD